MDAKSAELLMDMGISLLDPAPGIGKRIRDRAHFAAMLRATPLAKRKAAYEALIPHLSFDPLPYSLMKLGKRVGKKYRVTQ